MLCMCMCVLAVYIYTVMFKSSSTAYKEKMKEISVLSLICSCLYPETPKNIMGDFEGMW